MIRLTFSAGILALLLISAGCSKETNIVAPSGSTIKVSAIPASVSAGGTASISAVVKDANGKEMNGLGVRFTSSNPSVASLTSTAGTAQISQSTDSSGIATVIVTTFVGTTGSADITADIAGASDKTTLTVN